MAQRGSGLLAAMALLAAGLGATVPATAAVPYETVPPLSVGNPAAVNLGAGLAPNQSLVANQYLQAGDGQYELDMYPNGIGVLWATLSGTDPCPMWIFPPPTDNVMSNYPWTLQATPSAGSVLVMQGDGNFVQYPASGPAIWASNTANNPGATLSLQGDGNLVVYLGSQPLWSTSSNNYRGPILCKNNVLQPNQGLVQSAFMSDPVAVGKTNTVGAYHLLVNSSGELEILSALSPKKLASGPAGSYLIMQDDGNLVFYPPGGGASGTAIWATGTNGYPGAVAIMSNWGSLFVVDPQSGLILWDSSHKSEGQTLGKAAKISMDPGL